MLVGAGEADPAAPARDERFDGDPVTDRKAPTLGRVDADLVDDTDGFVAGHEGVAEIDDTVHLTAVLLDVGAADAARLDAEDRVVTPDLRPRQLDELDGAGASLDRRDDGAHCGAQKASCPLHTSSARRSSG